MRLGSEEKQIKPKHYPRKDTNEKLD